ncbi:hypothetical protein E1B28_010643 [Marasmius oreades]|uniref:Uncharacterized protein n=1 Tax=Marasmius oreades TaxID=181124 RepID=A0A9P7UTV7_9AGAR|nr:uncharacterized protein E1B28_010643 [Marasmius oreades]KAG7091624.1 hypothetical protein E1B28_010643 [Marasmius oreades]
MADGIDQSMDILVPISWCLVLAIRVWAVWAWKPLIGIMIVVLSAACGIPGMFFLSRFLNGIQYPELDIPGASEPLQRCFYRMTNKEVVVPWILLMVCDMAGFILMAIPGIGAYRDGGSSGLVKIVYRDGVIYYALTFSETYVSLKEFLQTHGTPTVVSLINVIVILLLSNDLVLLLSGLERVLHSILASHVILHIRKMASQDNGQMRDMSTGMLATVEFSSEFTRTEDVFATSMYYRSGFELEGQQLEGDLGSPVPPTRSENHNSQSMANGTRS